MDNLSDMIDPDFHNVFQFIDHRDSFLGLYLLIHF